MSFLWNNSGLWLMNFCLSLLLAPLLPGIINVVKSLFAGRQGPSVFQLYYDLFKLLRKSSVYSTSSTDILRLAPIAVLAAFLAAGCLFPFAAVSEPGIFSFGGDLILLVYLFAFARFMLVLGALDTASSFEGMGASREVQFSALAEPAFLVSLGGLVLLTGELSLSSILMHPNLSLFLNHGMSILLLGIALYLVLLAECCRVPFDDPNTHLELTMIHEAMILDYGGPDLAYILYGAALKMWLLASLVVMTLLPFAEGLAENMILYYSGVFGVAVLIGITESVMARFRFVKVTQVLIGALTLALLAIILKLVVRGGV